MEAKKIVISEMTCNHCVMSVKKALAALPLNGAVVEIGSAEVEFDENKINIVQIENAIEAAGYPVKH